MEGLAAFPTRSSSLSVSVCGVFTQDLPNANCHLLLNGGAGGDCSCLGIMYIHCTILSDHRAAKGRGRTALERELESWQSGAALLGSFVKGPVENVRQGDVTNVRFVEF